MPADAPRNRLGFAQWLVRAGKSAHGARDGEPFLAGTLRHGHREDAGDFGMAGEPPSHPELLDWLAVEFRESGWDVKRIFKLMVMSATYRQSAVVTPEKLEKDPQNRLLARGPRFRMDAEMVRDYALAASGLLVEKIGGPSVQPYQPPGIWEAVGMPGGNTRNYMQDTATICIAAASTPSGNAGAPPASMEIFNAPDRARPAPSAASARTRRCRRW